MNALEKQAKYIYPQGVQRPAASDVALLMPLELLLPLELVPWRRWPGFLLRRLRWWLHCVKMQLRCGLLGGHNIVKKAWVHAETREVGEYHCGCTRCTYFWTEDPTGRQTREPRMMYLDP